MTVNEYQYTDINPLTSFIDFTLADSSSSFSPLSATLLPLRPKSMGRKSSAVRPSPSPANNHKTPELLTVGSRAEARSDEEGFKGVWYAGKIVKSSKRKKRFVIQYNDLLSDEGSDKPLEEWVDISLVRPSPPPAAPDQRFQVHDVVDAFHRDGWWRGVVGKVETSEGEEKFTVFFQQSNEKIRFRASDLRFHLVWEDGSWSQPTKEEIPTIADCEEKSADDEDEETGSNEVVTSPSGPKHQNVKRTSSKRKRGQVSVSKDESPLHKSRNVDQGENLNVSQGTTTQVFISAENADVAVRTPSVELVEDQVEIVGESSNSGVDDQVPSTNTESEGHVENLDQTPPSAVPSDDGRVENLNQSVEVTPQADSRQVEELVLPFKKSLPLWEHVDSLDVFRKMPQNPHFSPLFELNEVRREGYAVGLYLNFAKLVEITSNIRVNEPRKVFETNLKALADLELHGFAVQPVMDRLQKLLSIKTRLEELESELKDDQIKVAQCDAEKDKVEDEIKEIDEKISMLEAKRAMKVSEKLIKESERDSLVVVCSGIDEKIAKVELDFENEASAPW